MEQLPLDPAYVYNNFVYVDDENEIISLTSDGYIVKYNLITQKSTNSNETYLDSRFNDRHQILSITNDRSARFIICQDNSYKICWINYNTLELDWKSSQSQKYHYVLECLPNGNVASLNSSGEVHVYQYKVENAIYSRTDKTSFYDEDSYKPLGVISNNIVITQSNGSKKILLLHYLNKNECVEFSTEIDTWIHCIKNYPENESDFLVLCNNKKISKYTIGSSTPKLITSNCHNGDAWKCLTVSRSGIIGYVDGANVYRIVFVYNDTTLKSIDCPIKLHFIEFTHDENIIFSQSKSSIYHITNPLKEMNDKIYRTRIFLGIKDLVLFTSLTSNNEKISMPTLNSWADWLDIVQHQIIIVSGYQFKIIEFNREFTGEIKINIHIDPFDQMKVIFLGETNNNIDNIIQIAKQYNGIDKTYRNPDNTFQSFAYELIKKLEVNKDICSIGYLSTRKESYEFYVKYIRDNSAQTILTDTIKEIITSNSTDVLKQK